MALEDYLQELKDPSRPLLASRLSELSSLSPDEAQTFSGVWPEIEVARRRQLLRRLLELAEDNVEMDFDRVFTTALKDEDADVRSLAVQGLWEHESRDVIPPLIELLRNDPSATVRAEAATSLGTFVLRAEFQRLHPADSRRIEEALRAAIDADQSMEVRGRAMESVGALSAPWVRDRIENAYRSKNWRLRVSAVHAMGRNCDPRWFSLLTSELESDSPEMRFEAATACASCCDESAIPHLKPLLEDEDAEVQEAVIAALGEIGGEEAREALEEMARHPEARVREAVASALEELEFNEDPLGFNLPKKGV
ncbi:MAG: HEAT repeat domain-containing protein [Dehalococcoidia bacterium]|jgi:HEAT repeat protein